MLLLYFILHMGWATAAAIKPQSLMALNPRAPLEDCINPTSQAQWQVVISLEEDPRYNLGTCSMRIKINTLCPSSLSTPSNCTGTSFYRKNCVAYCEQYLYWFFSQEVPFRGTACQPNDTCTYAGAKSIAVMNSYTFNGGLSIGGKSADLFEAAFNFGASYTYSVTSTTTQTLTNSRPENTLKYCGYWSFLPYYVQSCGFFISAERHTRYGGSSYLLFEIDPVCDSNTKVIFQCNNSTIVDKNGNTEGVTIFVATHCLNNTRVDLVLQDPRFPSEEFSFRRGLSYNFQRFTTYYQDDHYMASPLESGTILRPSAMPTCIYGCLCNYVGKLGHDGNIANAGGELAAWPYGACGNCTDSFTAILQGTIGGDWWQKECPGILYLNDNCVVPLTPTNVTLFTLIGVKIQNLRVEGRIRDVPEDYPNVPRIPFECFGEPLPPEVTSINYPCGPYGNGPGVIVSGWEGQICTSKGLQLNAPLVGIDSSGNTVVETTDR